MKLKVYNKKPEYVWVDEGEKISCIIKGKAIFIDKKTFDITVENSFMKLTNNCGTIEDAKKKAVDTFK